MKISLHIEADTPQELQEAISGLAAVHVPSRGQATTETKQTKRNTTPKEEKKPKEEQVVEKETPVDQEATSEADQQDTPTVVELRTVAAEKGKTAEGKKAIKALLDKFESKSISTVPEEKRAAFLVELEAL